MEKIPSDPLLEFAPNALEEVRKMYGLEKPGAMDQAIDILQEWITKQHFTKKDFSRQYLEIAIISYKGSIERTKTRMGQYCLLKTLHPTFFEFGENIREELKEVIKYHPTALLPKQTKDFCRIFCLKSPPEQNNMTDASVFNHYKYFIMLSEYMKAHDYFAGVVSIVDMSNLNIGDAIAKMNVTNLTLFNEILSSGTGFRNHSIHFITQSKMIDGLLAILKKMMSKKLSDRIVVHKSMDGLKDHLPKEILPKDFGGDERPFDELCENTYKAITSDENLAYLRMMAEARTTEAYKQTEQYNEALLGMPGTFRALSVD